MKKTFLLLFCLLCVSARPMFAVDMQAHMGTAEAQGAYTIYLSRQQAYYTGDYTYSALQALEGDELFGKLNELMGQTCKLKLSSFSYKTLRDQYKNVDMDLNEQGNIIGYYDGESMDGTWGTGYNREHTWPQVKFKGSHSDGTKIPMGYDMQSVRPTSTSINSDRGSDPYGESGSYYDPDKIKINNPLYIKSNLGSYRGDCARVILYDYVVYGKRGDYSNTLYDEKVKADLPKQVGTNSGSVFESLAILLKWHMNDPISLTEMVRNDGGQTYQGNRNPFIDYPEWAIAILKAESSVRTFDVTVNGGAMWPNYRFTLADGFIAYLGTPDERPTFDEVGVDGASFTYDEQLGRLTISDVTGNVTITTPAGSTTGLDLLQDETPCSKILKNGQILILRDGKTYNLFGTLVSDAQ